MKLFSLNKLFELYKFPFFSGFLYKISALFAESTVGKQIYGIFTNSSLAVVGSLNFRILFKIFLFYVKLILGFVDKILLPLFLPFSIMLFFLYFFY